MTPEEIKLVSQLETILITAEEKADELVSLIEEYEDTGQQRHDDETNEDYDRSEEAAHEVGDALAKIQELFKDELE